MTSKLPVFVALDCSGSMAGEPIDTLQDSMNTLLDELQLRQSDDSDVWVSIVAFNDRASEVQPLVPIGASQPVELSASGGTQLDAALGHINETIRRRVQTEPDWMAPEVLVMTDGGFAPGWEPHADELADYDGNVIGFGIGPGADVESLQRLSSDVALIDERAPELIRETVEWAGNVIRVASYADPLRVYPAPPPAIRHIPGYRSRAGGPRRWSDDPDLTEDELREFHERELERRELEQEAREREIARREVELKRRETEELQRKKREELVQRKLEDEPGTPASTRRTGNSARAIVLAGSVRDTYVSVLEETSTQSNESASKLANQCGFHLMAIRSEEAKRLPALANGLHEIGTACLGLSLLDESSHREVAEALEQLQAIRTSRGHVDEVEVYAQGMRLLNVLSRLESYEKDPFPQKLMDAIELADTDIDAARVSLPASRNIYTFTPKLRLAATAAISKAATELATTSDLDRVSLYLDAARRATPPGSALAGDIDLLEVAQTAIAESQKQKDDVTCTVFSHSWIKQSTKSLVQVVLHLPKYGTQAHAVAIESDPGTKRRGYEMLTIPLSRGEEFAVTLDAGELGVNVPTQRAKWNGDLLNIQFLIEAHDTIKASREYLTVTVYRRDVPIGSIVFSIDIVPNSPWITGSQFGPSGNEASSFAKAFVSYATVDRKAAVERTQVLASIGIEVFIDSLSLSPGERWEKRLYKSIDECDLFYLIWSKSAKESRWVKKESLRAVSQQKHTCGLRPKIYPVILPPPPPPEPWPELEEIHFNDKQSQYYFMSSHQERQG